MFLSRLIYIFTIFIVEIVVAKNGSSQHFPENFLFGVSSSAYQIEGGWDSDGKGPSIWDEFTHLHPEKIVDRQNGDVGANSYEYYLDDVEAVKSLNMNFYRFSISWTRILPTGDLTQVNEKGIEYYNKIINKLIEYKIEPMVTMYHFDLPAHLQLLGGFANSAIVQYFEEYANLLFNRFGDRVKYWITINEAAEFCVKGYGGKIHAPGINAHGKGEYLCVHNALKSHAVAYHLYKREYYNQYKGQVGIALDSSFFYSDSNDTVVVNREMQFTLGWIAHPIFSSDGDYPAVMIDRIANHSKAEGRLVSRLPTFSNHWKRTIQGTSDFFGLNYYTSRYIRESLEPIGENPSVARDRGNERFTKPEWIKGASDWLYSVPKGLGDLLRWIKAEYNNPEVIITENGWSDDDRLEDDSRVTYFHDHLEQVLDVILNNGCNVKAFSVWSLVDNFEWSQGYTEKFGMFFVNMSSPRKERIPKKSAYFMEELIKKRSIPGIY